jgi:hypothetical protein
LHCCFWKGDRKRRIDFVVAALLFMAAFVGILRILPAAAAAAAAAAKNFALLLYLIWFMRNENIEY